LSARPGFISSLALLALVCACGGEEVSDRAETTRPGQANGEHILHLYVSNQSFGVEHVRITISIDGREVVDETFDVEGQHNFVLFALPLEGSPHVLSARAAHSGLTFETQLVLPGELWALLQFWQSDSEPATFTWNTSGMPIGFR
jgi:hypothetical protein